MEIACSKVWSEIAELRKAGVDTTKLEDTFCDFECSMEEHVHEHEGPVEKKVSSEQTNYADMYVYEANVVADLLELVTEYVGEAEHGGGVANCGEVSSDTVDDITAWTEKRKQLLVEDFLLYWSNAE